MSKYKEMVESLTEVFRESAKGIVAFSKENESKLERWSDQTPLPDGRGLDRRIGFTTKLEFSDALNFVMDIVNIPDDDICDLRVWLIKTEIDSNKDEIFNQLSLTFSISEQTAKREIAKGVKFNIDDVMNMLNKDKLAVKRAVLSNNTGLRKKTDKRLGLRKDYDFIDKTVFTSSESEPIEEVITEVDQNELKKTLKTIMGNIKDPKVSKSK